MNKISELAAFILFVALSILFSCKREYSCEGCAEKNKPPIAVAGPDQVITLPTDSVSLDGNRSSDPDGTISEWLWTKLSGPASFNIVRQSDSISKVRSLVMGTYMFELKVTDNGGLSASDTVQISVNDRSQPNRPPAANAGADQTITLPTNIVTLNGNGSTDPDNNITSYLWTKISGPSSFNIVNTNIVQTQVTNLSQGTNLFELKVTDALGLFSKDTMQVSVINNDISDCEDVAILSCDFSNRPEINAQLLPVGNLSQSGTNLAIASADNKILFSGSGSTRVDIYDITSNNWATAELSQARSNIGVAVLNDKIFFAGGLVNSNTDEISSRVDIYNILNNSWSTAELSRPREKIAGIASNNKVLFAGGWYGDGTNPRVDIYDAGTNSWSTAELSHIAEISSATSIEGNVYFAGGYEMVGVNGDELSCLVDVYNTSFNTWSIVHQSTKSAFLAGISVGNKNYWAGGIKLGGAQNIVEIMDVMTNAKTFACLFQPNANFKAVLKENKIVFFTGDGAIKNKFDIYNIATDTWSIGVLPVNIERAAIISVNNIIYVAGGNVNGVLSSQVWKLEF